MHSSKFVICVAATLASYAVAAPSPQSQAVVDTSSAADGGGSYGPPPGYGQPPGYGGSGSGNGNIDRANAVKEAFLFAWNNYYQYAFPNDEIQPLTKGVSNPRNGWGASAVDALSTACVMELPDVVNQIIEYIPKINYGASKDDSVVSLFETTIRYIGGMLSGYDFLTGPLSYIARDPGNVKALLEQSQNLANYLSFAFETPSGVPFNNIYVGNQSNDGSTTNGLATVGTLILEWTRLADLSGNKTYADLVSKAESYLLNPKPAFTSPWPGLVGSNINISNGNFVDGLGGWVGGDDSYYEYLIKMYVYDADKYASFKDVWTHAADSSMAHLASHPSSRPDLTYLARFNFTRLIYQSQHLACFDGGNFILGGSVLGRQDYIDFGLELASACHNTYTSTATGIGPEIFSWNTTTLPQNQTDFYNKNGFWIQDSSYDLRPEVIESWYYAYQLTRDTKYQDWAWDAFVAINASCRAQYGFSAISDVNTPGGGNKTNDQESFLFAEVLKYAYLIQAPDREWDFNYQGKNGWVYNTEAHPFKVHGSPV